MNTSLALSHGLIGKNWRTFLREFLFSAGVEIGGSHPFDLRVLDEAFYDRALPRGVEGILDAYVDGWWETDRLDELTARVLSTHLLLPVSGLWSRLRLGLAARLLNRESAARASRVQEHYDLGNDLFEGMLDPQMIYSCAYWKSATTLAEAQQHKLDLIAGKVGLRPGMRVLDIGCGWGGFAKFAAERHGASVVGITLSREQVEWGRALCAGLPVELRLQDYRDLDDGPFDAIVSIGMFEHVGCKNYRTFMETVRRSLKPKGLFLLQTIGRNTSAFSLDPWFERNIFSVGMIPSATQISRSSEGLWVMEDWHNFGADYDRALLGWFENFEQHWARLREKYGSRFYRKWKCYLLTCAGAFRAREMQLWQIVLSPSGVPGGYVPVR